MKHVATIYKAETAHAKLKKQLDNSMCTFGTSWDKIHPLIELQHTEIKASFEKSLSFVHHDCRKEDFKDLIGFVSISALNNIMVELKWLDYIGVDMISCGWIIKHTHGLPCAHEM